VAEFAGHPRRALDDVPVLDHAAAEASADDGGNRAAAGSFRAVPHVVSVKGGGVAVVVVDDRDAEAPLERAPDVEPVPAGVAEVGRAPGGEHPRGTRRARRVQPDREHLLPEHTGHAQNFVKGVNQRLDGLLRPLTHEAGQFRHRVHKEPAV